jgi:hypothetical protein
MLRVMGSAFCYVFSYFEKPSVQQGEDHTAQVRDAGTKEMSMDMCMYWLSEGNHAPQEPNEDDRIVLEHE